MIFVQKLDIFDATKEFLPGDSKEILNSIEPNHVKAPEC